MKANWKKISTKDRSYNYCWNNKTGETLRWGKTKDEDPEYCPIGPEILDIEVSTICSRGCLACYKTNTNKGINMSLSTFIRVVEKFPRPPLHQLAIGIGDINANPDLPAMIYWCRKNNIMPNITINGSNMTHFYYNLLAKNCGSIGISIYNPPEVAYQTVEELLSRGASQINLHVILSGDTLGKCISVVEEVADRWPEDQRLAILFLLLKPKGNRNNLHQLKKLGSLIDLVKTAQDNKVQYGFDSCCANNYMKVVDRLKLDPRIKQMVEPCESGLFSSYVSASGTFYPCSFTESYWPGIDVTQIKDFNKELWHAPITAEWRKKLLANNRCCPAFDLEMEDPFTEPADEISVKDNNNGSNSLRG